MRKFIALCALALTFATVMLPASSAQADVIKRVIKDQQGNVLFRCGSVYRHRQVGVVRPGTVLINQAPVVLVAPIEHYSPRQQQFIRACNANHTLFANSHQPILNIGIGVTRHLGGGDSETNVYGSSAASTSNSAADADANSQTSGGKR